MDTQIYNYIKFVHFMNVQEWSVQFMQGNLIKYSNDFPLVAIGKFLSRNKTQIEVKDGILYKRPTIRTNNGGICLRDIKVGNEIGTKNQFLIKEGQFLLSKIDARNGAFGVVPHDCDKGIITGNFWTFDVDYSQINPFFLSLVTTTKAFIDFAERASNGTTNRHYLQEDKFLKEKIPLPSIEEQNALVSAYEALINQAETLEKQATDIEANIEKYLLDTLGIEQATTKKHDNNNGFLQMVRFNDMERWDVWTNIENDTSTIYKMIKFGDIVIKKPQYGANVRGVKKRTNTRYIRITDINEDGTLNDDFISPEFVEKRYRLNQNDFLIARSENTVGKTFLYDKSIGESIFAGYLVRYILNINKVVPKYLLYYTKSQSFKKWIIANQRISGQPNINGQEYLNAPIPLPDKPIQDEIVAHINSEKEKIKNKKAEAAKLRNEALARFEKSIFE
jgi:type I restriction enzyme S subunit